jgi:predicted dehydrogenase
MDHASLRDPAVTSLRWGVLGVAGIAVKAVIPAIQRSHYGRVVAIASRDSTKARHAQETLALDRAYGSYEELLADATIDAVYNPLPNHLHVPWTIKAMEAGKHVLCEKPIAMNAAEASLLRDAETATGKRCSEAFMVSSHPQWVAVRELIAAGRIGTLQLIDAHFSYSRTNPDDVRNHKAYGGGVLMDVGCYPLLMSRWLFGSEPVAAWCDMDIDPVFGVDRLVSAVLQFPNGRATFNCGGQTIAHQTLHCFGSSGRIHVPVPFTPPSHVPSTIHVVHATGPAGPGETISFDAVNQYTLQADNFARAVSGHGAMPVSLDDSIANMRAIDTLFRSAQSGRWEPVPTA